MTLLFLFIYIFRKKFVTPGFFLRYGLYGTFLSPKDVATCSSYSPITVTDAMIVLADITHGKKILW